MTTFSNSPKLLKGDIVPIGPVTSEIRRNIALQYNRDSISRSLQVQDVGRESDESFENPMQLIQQIAQSVYGGIGHE